MKRTTKMRDLVIALSLVAASSVSVANAAPNPVSQSWVINYSTLVEADWTHACDIGTPETGCYGKFPSDAALKIYRLADTVGIGHPKDVVQNSIYIKKFDGTTTTPTSPLVTNMGSNDALCYWVSPEGKNLGYMRDRRPSDHVYDAHIAMTFFGVPHSVSLVPLYGCIEAGSCDEHPDYPLPFYVFCFGTNNKSLAPLSSMSAS